MEYSKAACTSAKKTPRADIRTRGSRFFFSRERNRVFETPLRFLAGSPSPLFSGEPLPDSSPPSPPFPGDRRSWARVPPLCSCSCRLGLNKSDLTSSFRPHLSFWIWPCWANGHEDDRCGCYHVRATSGRTTIVCPTVSGAKIFCRRRATRSQRQRCQTANIGRADRKAASGGLRRARWFCVYSYVVYFR